MGWLVCVFLASFSSPWLHCGSGVCGNGSLGCTNNNYASREKCKKCGQPKEVAAMPAIAMSGATLPTHLHYLVKTQGVAEQNLNIRLLDNGALQQSLSLSSNWSLGGANNYGVQLPSAWPLGGNHNTSVPYANHTNQLMLLKGWRNGDWICNCGFHNYSSRVQCKKCNASTPPSALPSLISNTNTALGTKRLASEEFVNDWDKKRLNAGHALGLQQGYPAFEQMVGSSGNQTNSVYHPFPNGSSEPSQNFQVNLQLPHLVKTPTLVGKGAKHWRDGDWMCTNCSNHNYASRSHCNRCKTQRDPLAQPVSVE